MAATATRNACISLRLSCAANLSSNRMLLTRFNSISYSRTVKRDEANGLSVRHVSLRRHYVPSLRSYPTTYPPATSSPSGARLVMGTEEGKGNGFDTKGTEWEHRGQAEVMRGDEECGKKTSSLSDPSRARRNRVRTRWWTVPPQPPNPTPAHS